MLPVLEAVPNFSEGKDLALVRELVRTIASEGAEVLDWSADPDHNRSVITYVGAPEIVENAALAAARLAIDAIDLRRHLGVHPRVGALDVLPLVPLEGISIADASESAHRVARGLAELGVPVYFYGSGVGERSLSSLRAGGFEALVGGFAEGRLPDLLPEPWAHAGAHPSAGVTCVTARGPLLAWNVYVSGLAREQVADLAARLRESGGGFKGLRALGLLLSSRGKLQISMNLEDLEVTPPFRVFEAIEAQVSVRGGRIEGTEVIGMIPDTLVFSAGADRLRLLDSDPSRLITPRLSRYLLTRIARQSQALSETMTASGARLPDDVDGAFRRLLQTIEDMRIPGYRS